MPVVQVVDVRHGGWTGSQSISRAYQFSRKFLVEVNSKEDGPQVVLSHPYIPKIGDTYAAGYDSMAQAICINREAKCSGDSPMIWEVECEFSSETTSVDIGSSDAENPFTAPVLVNYDMAQFTKVAEKGRFIPYNAKGVLFPYEKGEDDAPILNSAFQKFDPPPEMDDSRPVLSLTKNFSSFDFYSLAQYRDAINSDEFYGCPPRTLKIAKINANRETTIAAGVPITYFRVSVEFHFNPDDWSLKLLDQGLMEFNDAEDGVVNITDDNGEPIAQAVNLDGFGHKGTPVDGVVPDFYRVYFTYRSLPFSSLGF